MDDVAHDEIDLYEMLTTSYHRQTGMRNGHCYELLSLTSFMEMNGNLCVFQSIVSGLD